MHNAFLVIRTVFFALLTYFHVLILIFASWNITAAKSSGMSAPGASILHLIISVLIFMLVPIAYLAELICVKARPAQVRLECAWTVLMSIFQLAASIDVTVNGPPMYCQTHSQWAMCASSSLLVHISWLATLIILSYCLTICVTSATHAMFLPDIWITPVPHVSWFRPDPGAQPPATRSHKPADKRAKVLSTGSSWSESSCAVSKYIAERWEKLSRIERQPVESGPITFTRGHQSSDSSRPVWARQRGTRRGIDNPFATPPLPKRKEPPVTPLPKTPRPIVTSRNLRSMGVREQLEGMKDLFSTLAPRSPTEFLQRFADPDLPIPRPSRSEWVRADALVGSNTRKAPTPLP